MGVGGENWGAPPWPQPRTAPDMIISNSSSCITYYGGMPTSSVEIPFYGANTKHSQQIDTYQM